MRALKALGVAVFAGSCACLLAADSMKAHAQPIPGDPTFALLAYKHSGTGDAMLSQEFNTEDRCKAAGKAFSGEASGFVSNLNWVCVKK